MLANILPSREEIIKERERERLQRYLYIKFGRKKFGMYWTDYRTSYTDYSSIYVKYNLQTPAHRPFNQEELRLLRKAHALHERGHIEFDVSGVTYEWRQQHVSSDKKDWEANIKYPMGWLKYFSGTMIDVRMEHLVVMALPEAKDYFDFCNYHWRFGIRGENAGVDRLHDFRECLASRGFGLTDISEWHPEAVQLVDSVMNILKDIKFSRSTQECMDNTLRLVKAVWPTLWDWMVQDQQEDQDLDYDESGHDMSSWGDPDDVKQNTERVLTKVQLQKSAVSQSGNTSANEMGSDEDQEGVPGGSGPSAGEDTSKNEEPGLSEQPKEMPDFKSALKNMAAELAADEKAADKEIGPYMTQEIEVSIPGPWNGQATESDRVILTPFNQNKPEIYDKIKEEVSRQIQPIAAALKKLLEPTPDQRLLNQRSGRLNVTKVWAASVMDDPNIFTRTLKGSPGCDARILVLEDCSGSTSSLFIPGQSRIDAMKKAIVLLSEATQVAKIPTAVYAFTESSYAQSNGAIHYPAGSLTGSSKRGTIIFPLKPFGKLTKVEKGFIGGLEPQDGNRDTVALQWAVNELKRYREAVRLLIVISDGQPNFGPNENENTMKSIVQQARRDGIDVLCLFIGADYYFDNVKKMYPGGAIFVSKNLARDLTQHVLQIIKRRRR